MKVSFDFDSTLATKPMQDLCKKFIKLGADVFVTTTRAEKILNKPTNNDDLFQLVDKLGIPRENVTFTKYEDKYTFVKDMDIHIDDNIEEIFLINQHPSKCMGFLYEEKPENGIPDW